MAILLGLAPLLLLAVSPAPVPQDALIKIYAPASGSMVKSPLHVLASVSPGAGGKVSLRVVSETGRTVAQKEWAFTTVGGNRITIDQSFPFSVDGVAEAARLVIFTRDAEGRLIALSSEDILLLGIGKTKLNEAGDLLEPFQIFQPLPEENIHHGVIQIRGSVRPMKDALLIIEVVGPDGTAISGIQLVEDFQAAREFMPLSMDLQFQVQKKTSARLTLRFIDPETKENLAVFSQVVILYP